MGDHAPWQEPEMLAARPIAMGDVVEVFSRSLARLAVGGRFISMRPCLFCMDNHE
jgi:hypothetical protein